MHTAFDTVIFFPFPFCQFHPWTVIYVYIEVAKNRMALQMYHWICVQSEFFFYTNLKMKKKRSRHHYFLCNLACWTRKTHSKFIHCFSRYEFLKKKIVSSEVVSHFRKYFELESTNLVKRVIESLTNAFSHCCPIGSVVFLDQN